MGLSGVSFISFIIIITIITFINNIVINELNCYNKIAIKDMNMLKIFTLGTRFSDFIHKIQQDNTPKQMYITNTEKSNVSFNFDNTLEALSNQLIGK